MADLSFVSTDESQDQSEDQGHDFDEDPLDTVKPLSTHSPTLDDPPQEPVTLVELPPNATLDEEPPNTTLDEAPPNVMLVDAQNAAEETSENVST